MEDREMDYLVVRVATTYSEGIQTFKSSGINIDDDFVNILLHENEEEDLLSIRKEDVRLISSKRVYKED